MLHGPGHLTTRQATQGSTRRFRVCLTLVWEGLAGWYLSTIMSRALLLLHARSLSAWSGVCSVVAADFRLRYALCLSPSINI